MAIPNAPLGTFQYQVIRGDTLYRIARNFNTTVSILLRFNPILISNPNILRVGQLITIPQSPPEAIIYTVRPGDTLSAIARRFGTRVSIIIMFNYLTNPNRIFPGQQLVIAASLR
jgi:LysM repeat protein